MIHIDEEKRLFHLIMKDASYVFGVGPSGHLVHYHYGKKIEGVFSGDDFDQSPFLELGSSTTHSKTDKPINLNITPLEVSTYGKGDYREPTIHIENHEGYRSIDFLYVSHEIIKNLCYDDIPQADKKETLQITLKATNYLVYLKLNYTVYHKENTIIRNMELIQKDDEVLTLDRMLSANFDFLTKDYQLLTLDGAWIRERHMHWRDIDYGIIKIDSKKGVSSSDHNPFFALKEKDATQSHGHVYGFNLIYSGNFEANIEVSPHDLTRVNLGINSFDFKWMLKKDERFITPEVLTTFSKDGMMGLKHHMDQFIQTYITKNSKPRPIILNNWEATYFDFNDKTIISIAKKAKKLGVEGFVLDDGWFGERNDDTSSLGDWYPNTKKLKKGISNLSKRIKKEGLLFGLWVEPEMVSPNSNLYQKHPEWAIRHPEIEPAKGRNQLILDLSNPLVINYLYESLSKVFEEAEVDYVKWDMNRNFSDLYSTHLKPKDQGKLVHLYTLGLYQLLERLKKRFPQVLFESCASGGNRFDLGMHYYMPQAWTSDDTDAYERLKIQRGTYTGYPQSTISNHINDDIAHQTIRSIPLETRFHVACFGILGLELDPRTLSPFNKKIIKKQLTFYKEHRMLFQYGQFYDLSQSENDQRFMVVSPDQNEAILGIFQSHAIPNPPVQSFRLKGLDESKTYHIISKPTFENLKRFGGLIKHALPIKLKAHGTMFNILSNHYMMKTESFETVSSGAFLMHHGLPLEHRFTGTGYHEQARMMMDHSSRLYILKEVNHGNH